jgi:hypothetical protein
MLVERDPAPRLAPSLAPEHEWSAAARLLHPALRPAGTIGVDGRSAEITSTRGLPGKPLIVAGPADLTIGYIMPGPGFGVLVGIEHLLAWGVGPGRAHSAAMANLAGWSSSAPWEIEVNGSRRVVWSDSGGGMDAARILLPEVRGQLASDLGAIGRVVIGVPERDLLIATCVAEGDDEWVAMMAAYVTDRSHSADDPIDPRLFELVGGDLVVLDWM